VQALPGTERAAGLVDTAVVLPAYNEERRVAEVIEAALALGVGRIVCVDDCSTDRTGQILEAYARVPRIDVVHHEVNQGKQAAVKHGLAQALRCLSVRRVATLDADMQHDPAELPRAAAPVPRCDVVSVARRREGMPLGRRAANLLANWPYRFLAGLRIHDVQSGYRVYTRDVAEYLARRLGERGGYTVEHSTLVLLGELSRRWGRTIRVGEIFTACSYRGAESGIRLRDNLQLTWASLECSFRLARLLRG